MPGEENLKTARRRRAIGLGAILALLAVLGAWGMGRVAAATRHQITPPTRSLPERDDRTVFEAQVPPADILKLVADGKSEGQTSAGTRITLALDEELQAGIFELFRRFDPPYGVFAAMEPATGRVVALVGYRKGGESDPSLALKAIYPAASLFKVVTAAAAVEKGNVTPEEGIGYRGGIYSITKRNIRAKDGRGTPTMSLEEAIARSANSVFGKVAVNYVGSQVLEEYMGKFGFGEPIPFVLPVETSKGDIPREEYSLARTGAGFGEVYVSPLHMAMIMSALGEDGEMPHPILVESVEDKDGKKLYEDQPGKWRDTVTPETAETLVRMMVKTIEIGTSRRAFAPGTTPLLDDMEVAGKTGSLSGWTPRMHFEWFAGLAPVGDPKLAVAALVVNGSKARIKGSYVGKEAFNTYFGYPSSAPPAYRAARGKARGKKALSAAKAGKKQAARKRSRKPAAAGSAPAPPPTPMRTGFVTPGRATRG